MLKAISLNILLLLAIVGSQTLIYRRPVSLQSRGISPGGGPHEVGPVALLRGRVLNGRSGLPVVGARVLVCDAHEGCSQLLHMPHTLMVSHLAILAETRTNDIGSFTINPATPGGLFVHVIHPEFEPGCFGHVRLRDGQEFELSTLYLRPWSASTISGTEPSASTLPGIEPSAEIFIPNDCTASSQFRWAHNRTDERARSPRCAPMPRDLA